jgi:hypothetical protein
MGRHRDKRQRGTHRTEKHWRETTGARDRKGTPCRLLRQRGKPREEETEREATEGEKEWEAKVATNR